MASPVISPRYCVSSCLSAAVTSSSCLLHPRTDNHNPRDARSIARRSQCARSLATDRRGSRLRLTICSSLTLSHTFSLPSVFHRHVYPALCLSSLDSYVDPMSHIHLNGSVSAARARARERVVKAAVCLSIQTSGLSSEPNHQLHLAFQEWKKGPHGDASQGGGPHQRLTTPSASGPVVPGGSEFCHHPHHRDRNASSG